MDDIVIAGGGPSGLAAANQTASHGARTSVIERLIQAGGLARTELLRNNRWDIGPHRSVTKNSEVQDLFVKVVGEDLIQVSRLTRILYNNRYFDYPLTPINALLGVGIARSLSIFGSYAFSQARRT